MLKLILLDLTTRAATTWRVRLTLKIGKRLKVRRIPSGTVLSKGLLWRSLNKSESENFSDFSVWKSETGMGKIRVNEYSPVTILSFE